MQWSTRKSSSPQSCWEKIWSPGKWVLHIFVSLSRPTFILCFYVHSGLASLSLRASVATYLKSYRRVINQRWAAVTSWFPELEYTVVSMFHHQHRWNELFTVYWHYFDSTPVNVIKFQWNKTIWTILERKKLHLDKCFPFNNCFFLSFEFYLFIHRGLFWPAFK